MRPRKLNVGVSARGPAYKPEGAALIGESAVAHAKVFRLETDFNREDLIWLKKKCEARWPHLAWSLVVPVRNS
ncbi:MAG: hypothetical protein IT349_19395 [Candidatus Eisenbacteria bacterium]|nr:hypothetical protein [Candidatus Eisenbacteria bacterium]